MGYIRGTPAIKRSALLTITESENTDEYRKSTKDGIHLEPKHNSPLKGDYLKQNISSLDSSSYVARRRMFEVNGDPLDHWQKDNFESKRDATCRIVYEPKTGRKFFQNNLLEDYAITRGLVASLEQPYFSKYNRFFPTKGHFCCKACGNPLYSSEAKFDVDDGWPAFGACILGSIGVTPVEIRMAQIEKKERACTIIQAVIRGHLCRNRVKKLLDELIEQLLRRKHGYESSVNGEHDDWSSEGHMSSEFSWSSSSDESDNSKRSNGINGEYVLSRDFGDDYAEIHCHRCKSHLGDVFAQKNTGRNGEAYRERHRVNGRAIKYMDQDLPKKTIGDSSLLFADQSQRRRLGLPNFREDEAPSLPFGTLHWLRKTSNPLFFGEKIEDTRLRLFDRDENNAPKLPFGTPIWSHKISSDPLSISNHKRVVRKRRKIPDPLSVSCHASLLSGNNYCKHSPPTTVKFLSVTPKSTKELTDCRRRPMRRGSTDNSLNIAELAARLEKELTFFMPDS